VSGKPLERRAAKSIDAPATTSMVSWIWAVSWGRPCEGLWGILNWYSQEIYCEQELTIRVLDASIGQITETDVDDDCEEDRGEHSGRWRLLSGRHDVLVLERKLVWVSKVVPGGILNVWVVMCAAEGLESRLWSEWWLASCNRRNCAYHEVGTGLGSLEPRTHNLYQFPPLQLPVRDENYRGQARLI
jgi:hypothetical protein